MSLRFRILDGTYSVVRLPPDADLPEWATRSAFFSVTRTSDELSIICSESLVAPTTKGEGGWRCIGLIGPFAFGAIGIAADITSTLAKAGVSLLLVSTFDTDYVLLRADNLERGVAALVDAGHTFPV